MKFQASLIKSLFIAVALVFSSAILLAQESETIELAAWGLQGVSESEQFYLDRDNFFNTVGREIFGRETKKVYVISADILRRYNPSLKVSFSTQQLPALGSLRLQAIEIKEQVLLDEEQYQWLRKFFAESLFTKANAVKVASHDTWWIWSTESPEMTPFFWKSTFARDARAKDYYSNTHMARVHEDLETITLVPEVAQRLSVQSPFDGSLIISNIVRPSFISHPDGSSKRVAPWFGFIGDPSIVNSLAEKNGISRFEFIRDKLVPLFARKIAIFNYGYGIFHASHGQNTTVSFDESSGHIEDIIFRDLRDIAIDASSNMFDPERNVSNYTLNKGNSDNVEGYKKWVALDEPGAQFALYTLQSLVALTSDFEEKRSILLKFFEEYVSQARLELGEDFEPSAKIEALMQKGTNLSQYEMGINFEEKVDGKVPLKGLAAWSAQMVRTLYVDVVNYRIEQLNLVDFPKSIGKKIIKDVLNTSRFHTLNPSALGGPYVFKTDGTNLYIYNRSGEIMGYLFDPEHWFKHSKRNRTRMGRRLTTWEEQISLLRSHTQQCIDHFSE